MNSTLLLFLVLQFAPELPAPSGETIVAPDARWEVLFTRSAPIKGGLTEGPAAAPDGSIYFSDIPVGTDRGMILRFNPTTNKTTVFAADSHKSNGLAFDKAGNLWACEGADYGGRCVSRWNTTTGERLVVAERFNGRRFNAPNDLCVDRQGRVYFTDPKYLGTESRELEYRAVYRLDDEGQVVEVTHDVAKPNGIALSPDGRRLYVADHDNGTDQIDPAAAAPKPGVMKIHAFTLDEKTGLPTKRETLHDFAPDKGCDGMTVDAAGNLYLTWRSNKTPGVLVLDPSGKRVGFLPTGPENTSGKDPVGLPSNVEFGRGDEANVMYCTVDLSLYRIRLKTCGYRPDENP
ncbi:MAG: SMP-30/gluconolactonase/LRE family protein [Planctomycetes bacterium]|nr:SMP-30/gluconolactonase/LRE family protein [Planctomycetota bacterium]